MTFLSQPMSELNSLRPIYTVSQLTGEIKTLLEKKFEHIWVEGEIPTFASHLGASLLYLKDESSQLRASCSGCRTGC